VKRHGKRERDARGMPRRLIFEKSDFPGRQDEERRFSEEADTRLSSRFRFSAIIPHYCGSQSVDRSEWRSACSEGCWEEKGMNEIISRHDLSHRREPAIFLRYRISKIISAKRLLRRLFGRFMA